MVTEVALEIGDLRKQLGDDAEGKTDDEVVELFTKMAVDVRKAQADGKSEAALAQKYREWEERIDAKMAAVEAKEDAAIVAPRTIEDGRELGEVFGRKFKVDPDEVEAHFGDTRIKVGYGASQTTAMSELHQTPETHASDEVKAFQDFCDDAVITAEILSARAGRPVSVGELKMWEPWSQGTSQLRKAMDTATASEGAEWLPTILSPRVFELARIAPGLANEVEWVPLSGSDDWPLDGADPTAYAIGEATADDAVKFRASTMGTAKIDWTLKKIGARVLVSAEAEEDLSPPVLAAIRGQGVRAMADAHDDILLNGDTTATHMDTGDVTASYDVRKMFNGVRDASLTASTQADLSTFTSVTLAGRLSALLHYAEDPTQCVWTANIELLASLLNLKDDQNNRVVIGMDVLGGDSTFVKGTVGQIFGGKLVWCKKARADQNASGVYDGSTTTYTNIHVFNKGAFKFGRKGNLTVNSKFDIERDQHILVFRERLSLAQTPTASATEPTAATGYKITP